MNTHRWERWEGFGEPCVTIHNTPKLIYRYRIVFVANHGRIECDGCQKVENFFALGHSKGKSVGQRFQFKHGVRGVGLGYEVSVCLQKN